jgi:hypothetical protein
MFHPLGHNALRSVECVRHVTCFGSGFFLGLFGAESEEYVYCGLFGVISQTMGLFINTARAWFNVGSTIN